MPKKPFVFNDESVKNSYGFSIPTKGISLKRFKKNPVMLNSHYNSTYAVLGRWEDIKITDKGLLTGMPVFDSDDESVSVIEGKVERGFIKSCSMGVSFNKEDLKLVAGNLILEKCELYEVSIVAVPSNANAIRLYADGSKTPLTDAEVQQLCLSVIPVEAEEIKPIDKNPKNENMKITLTVLAALALGFKETELEHEADVINQRIQKLGAEKQAAELRLEILEKDAKDAAEKAIETKVDLAIKANPALKEKREKLITLGLADEDLLDTTLGTIPSKASLSEQIKNPGNPTLPKTAEDFQKLSLEAQLKFKAENPTEYAAMFNVNQ